MDNVITNTSSSSADSDITPPPPTSHLPPKKEPGGWRSVKYILGNESFEKLASMGLIANLTVYLQTRFNMDGIQLVNVFNIWSGSTNVTPLLGAFLSDTYLGRFRTLIFGSTASFLGMVVMSVTAGIPNLRPLGCNGGSNCQKPEYWQLGVLYLGLGLLAIGAGGVRPCNIAFGADQFDTRTEKGRAQLESFFNWWYFSFTVALVIALTVVVYVQTNVSWVIGYGIPAVCLLFSIVIFLIGKHTYIITKPQGTVFVDLAKVIVAACKKRAMSLESTPEHSFYDPPLIESDQRVKTLDHTNMFKFFDKAALIADPSELDDKGLAKNSWRLCSVHQVEQLKLVIGLVPVWITGIGCFITMDQMNAFGLMQAIQSDNKIHNFKIPPGWMGLSSMISLSAWIFIYEQIYLPHAQKRSKKNVRLTIRQRINTGIVMAILCMVVAGIVEKSRRERALKQGSLLSPQSILLLLPQFSLSGLNEAFAAVAIMEYYTNHLPQSMRTLAGAIFFLSFSASSYLNTVIVNVVHQVTAKHGEKPWLGGRDLNEVKLDNFYYLIAGLALLNFLYFNLFSCRYLDKRSGFRHEDKGLEMNENV
uniref:Major facilitator superfamily (MFS) profile domain-containing protein n=1 Tax=Salix viminalis TaxID=40686 RepID=A0A6N2MRA7_SALVM